MLLSFATSQWYPVGTLILYHVASPQTASFIEIMADGQPKKSIEIIVLVDYSAFNAMIMIVLLVLKTIVYDNRESTRQNLGNCPHLCVGGVPMLN